MSCFFTWKRLEIVANNKKPKVRRCLLHSLSLEDRHSFTDTSFLQIHCAGESSSVRFLCEVVSRFFKLSHIVHRSVFPCQDFTRSKFRSMNCSQQDCLRVVKLHRCRDIVHDHRLHRSRSDMWRVARFMFAGFWSLTAVIRYDLCDSCRMIAMQASDFDHVTLLNDEWQLCSLSCLCSE